MDSAFLPSLVKAFVVVAIGLVLYLAGRRGLGRLRARGRLSGNGEFVARSALKWLLAVIVTIAAVQQFGISLHALWTGISAVLVLVAVGFVALWSVLSNMLCSIILVMFAPFRIGDRVEIIEVVLNDGTKSGVKGRVLGIDLMYTTLEDDQSGGSTLRIPNNMLFQRAIRTIHGEDTRSLGSDLFARNEGSIGADGDAVPADTAPGERR